MRRYIRNTLFAGAALALGTGAALAQMEPPPPAPDMYGPGPMRGRLADRALRDFDLNHDGKITKDEVTKVQAQRFSEVTGGGATMTEAQFAKAHEKFLSKRSEIQFRKIDWNGDGVLSLDEFRAPLRARFMMMDRDGTGTISCKPADRRTGVGRMGPYMKGPGEGPGNMRGPRANHQHFGGGLAKLCQQADLNKNGKATRAEFDKAAADKYAAAVKGGKGMTPAEFYSIELRRFDDMEARRFKRLDTNHDGKLSEVEFAAPGQKLFARLDRNHDGVVTKDELMSPRHAHRGGWGKKPR